MAFSRLHPTVANYVKTIKKSAVTCLAAGIYILLGALLRAVAEDVVAENVVAENVATDTHTHRPSTVITLAPRIIMYNIITFTVRLYVVVHVCLPHVYTYYNN